MFKRVLIIYFSGTGNTEYVAKKLAEAMENNGAQVDLVPVEKIHGSGEYPDPSKYDLVGFGYAVHSWEAPRIFFETLKAFPASKDKPAFLFKSAGDKELEGGSTARPRNILKRKGYRVFHEYNYLMPANVFVGYDDRFSVVELDLTDRITAKNAQLILDGKTRLQRNGPLKRLGSFLGVFEQIGSKRLGRRSFHTTDECNLCGACILKCPMQNISETNGKVKFGGNCLICFRCVYLCPKNAIKLRYFKFFVLKEGYDIRKIIRNRAEIEPMPETEILASKHYKKLYLHLKGELS